MSPTIMLQSAKLNRYAICAFNIHSFDMLQAVVEAATETKSPVIIQTSMSTVKNLGAYNLVASTEAAARHAGIPIALHLDHCTDFSMIIQCIRLGYTSVMIDASMHSFDVNIKQTRRIVEVAEACGVNVEAELGRVGNVADEMNWGEHSSKFPEPEDCKRFVDATKVTSLAPAVGTIHGVSTKEVQIDFSRINLIAKSVASTPLVLHGGSSIPTDLLKLAIKSGISKVNIATELRIAYTNTLKDFLVANPNENDPRIYLKPAKQAVKNLVIEKMKTCGCLGKANGIISV